MNRDHRTIRLLSVIESLGRGGAERMLVSMDHALDKQLFEHRVVSLFAADDLAEELRTQGTPVISCGLSGPEAVMGAVRCVSREIDAFEPHVVHTHLFTANVSGRLAGRRRAGIVTTLHNPDYGHDAGTGPRFLVRAALDRATGHLIQSRILAVSEHVRDDYRARMGFDGIEVLPNGVDVKGLARRSSSLEQERIRQELGLAPDGFVVAHVGRLHRQKGQDVLVSAFATLHRRLPSARLVIVGEGVERGALEALARTEGVSDEVHFAGMVDDVIPFLAAADVFAFPSRFEAFGIALLEAMAVGLPTVVTNIAGLNEIAVPGTSLMVPEGDAVALADALWRIHDEPGLGERLGNEGAVRARSFDLEPTVRRLEEVYAEVAGIEHKPSWPHDG